MKAGKVRGLDPSGSLADNAERIVAARLAELCAFAPAVLDERRVRELHDMRIAAKRLRYVLEVTAEPCFGPYARTAAKRTKELQDLLGEIHDCDVQLPRVDRLVAELRDEDAAELRRRAGGADDLDPALAARLPHAVDWRGLAALSTYLRARRGLLYDRFLTLWRDLGREGFAARLQYAIGERPEAEAPAPAATTLASAATAPASAATAPAPAAAATPAAHAAAAQPAPAAPPPDPHGPPRGPRPVPDLPPDRLAPIAEERGLR